MSDNYSALLSSADFFSSIDSDHWTRLNAAFDPPSQAANSSTQYGTTYTVVGARPGDQVNVRHSANNTRLHFNESYVSANDTVTVVATNPTGAAIDLGVGILWGQVLRPGRN